MKKIILSVVLLLVAQLTIAQDEFKADVIKVIKASGSASQMELAKDQIKAMIPEAKFEEFSKEFDETLPSLYDAMAENYMTSYTHDDVKEMLKFYESPVGKKISDTASEILKKNMESGKEWGMALQGMMMKYME
ncbi:DUF2059 domain-containing protein [uncultured Flavobacterium sp.]|uniref:DUF2059 domain-containing protein n=1 Tax=uncultured Flavobacterium sp. TaxID=165435 RepID=UPI0030CA3F5E|tara:strand:- start:3934 stop:4335 length:402 start_codon:yes stop_codon:yes gene_type:complete